MKKIICAILLVAFLIGTTDMVYAENYVHLKTSRLALDEDDKVDNKEVKDSAGVLPNSFFYGMERGMENLQIAFTRDPEKLATLKAKFAKERAAEAAIMNKKGEEDIAKELTTEYMKLLTEAVEHLNSAIESKSKPVKAIESVNESYKKSEDILKDMVKDAPEGKKSWRMQIMMAIKKR